LYVVRCSKFTDSNSYNDDDDVDCDGEKYTTEEKRRDHI
jgi:hypothetical protein